MERAFMVHGGADDRIERLLDEAVAPVAERSRPAVPRRPHLPPRRNPLMARPGRDAAQ
ncbi:hypothetical protein [Azospirillum halopraeferens]|uniref:hypothetical protein n=1 Tax=Azospirillum halopraeferens TaxID=34010 RepID=UPI00040AEA04|nr:hypothetical protein [Azospirillum halopraeferens]